MLGNSYCSFRIMTKFNFKVLNVDVFLSLSKMQMFGIQFGTMQNGGIKLNLHMYISKPQVRFLSERSCLKDSN